jgi:signal transduction histidine kinase
VVAPEKRGPWRGPELARKAVSAVRERLVATWVFGRSKATDFLRRQPAIIDKVTPAFLRTTTFRLAVVHFTLFLLFMTLLLTYVYNATAGQLTRAALNAADQDFNSIQAAFDDGGINGVSRAVSERTDLEGPTYYLLAFQDGRAYSGAFERLPVRSNGGLQSVNFAFQRPGPNGMPEVREAVGRMGPLPGGMVLLVARDLGEDAKQVRRISGVVWLGAALGLILSLGGGIIIARQAARRAEELSRTARKVMAGDLSERAPVRGSGDEFDNLATNLNEMLARIERLVLATRTAGDAIAHDLRSPLARLKTRIEDALSGPLDADTARNALEGAADEADKLLETFTSVLRLARVQNRDAWKFHKVNVTDIAEELAELYGPAAEEEGLAFNASVADRLEVDGDRSLVVQALANLLDNAIKYTPTPGRVALLARRAASGAIELIVEDDGPGVPEYERERVKERFVRLTESRSMSEKPGSGLGLSLSAGVAALFGGELYLEDGAGTTHERPGLRVRLVLPKPAPPPPKQKPPAPTTAAPTQSAPRPPGAPAPAAKV